MTALLAVIASLSGCFGMNRGHPEPNPVRGYRLEIAAGTSPFEPLNIGAQGEGCEVLLPDEDANRTCLIATSVHPGVIGSDDDEISRPAIDALIWKARSDGDVSVCQRSGRLSGAFLEECEIAAIAADYQYEGDIVRIRIPMGGAEPTPAIRTG